jgi:hypothetical protein
VLAVDLPGHGNSPARRPSGCQASPYFRCAAWKVRTLAPPLLLPRRRRTDVSPPVRAMTLADDAVVFSYGPDHRRHCDLDATTHRYSAPHSASTRTCTRCATTAPPN